MFTPYTTMTAGTTPKPDIWDVLHGVQSPLRRGMVWDAFQESLTYIK